MKVLNSYAYCASVMFGAENSLTRIFTTFDGEQTIYLLEEYEDIPKNFVLVSSISGQNNIYSSDNYTELANILVELCGTFLVYVNKKCDCGQIIFKKLANNSTIKVM